MFKLICELLLIVVFISIIYKWKIQHFGDGCMTSTSYVPAQGNTSENCQFLNIHVRGRCIQCNLSTIRYTKNGPVEGIEQTSILGKNYYAFKRIPYAEAPITGKDPYTGVDVDRRFKPPEPLIRKWTDNLKVQDFGDACIASTSFVPAQGNTSENCLFLNIYVPAGGAKEKTVLVWIHGGAFTEGTSNDVFYGPDLLIDPDNILVTINYRVGIFGFLNLGFGEYTGNMGLKDQQLALKWIYENIEHFSGNKNEILLFGQSAGGASVNYQMLNEESRKYFNRAFAMSSTALTYYALNKTNHLQRMMEFSNIQDKDQLIEYLKVTNSSTLAQISTTNNFGLILLKTPWAPTIESAGTKGAFITESPEFIYTSNKAPAIDAMFSFTSEEILTFNPELAKKTEPFLSGNWNESQLELPFTGFKKEIYPEEYKQAFELLKNSYLSDTTNVDAIKHGNIALLSDLNFGYDILKTVKYQVAANNKGIPNRNTNRTTNKNSFLFRFSVSAGINAFKILLQTNSDGALHADDVCYLFRCNILGSLYEDNLKVKDVSNVNYNTIMRLVKMITNFARTGNPSIEGDTPFKSSTTPNEIFVQDITNDSKSIFVTNITEQLHFDTWKSIEDNYQKCIVVGERYE